jgi:hypothetical protein
MSKSYGDYKNCGIATGSNTEWYKVRRRNLRHKNNGIIREILATYLPEEFDEIFTPIKIAKKDHWREPTDGTVRYDAKRINNMVEKNGGHHYGLYVNRDGRVKK